MKSLDRAPEVIRMARELGLDHRREPSRQIINFCLERIKGWLTEFADISSIKRVQRIVCAKLRLKVEEVHGDEDIGSLTEKYAVQKREGAFAHLAQELNTKTFAVLMERANATPSDPDKYVAVIDCRGGKGLRKFFTTWHEIAHVLTLYEQLQLPLHRSRDDGSPLERMMDTIAGEVGFYGPIFEPLLQATTEKHGRLCFAVVEEVQSVFCPDASFQATLIACVKRSTFPGVYLEIGAGLKKSEERLLESGQGLLGWETPPQPKLRVLNCSANLRAKHAGIVFHRNMEVPKTSLLARQVHGDFGRASENLASWTHSDGTALGDADIRIEARELGGSIIALVVPK